jgi:hypothetical protein
MPKTVTIRLDDDTYQMTRHAAKGQMRSISNFIRYGTIFCLTEETFVSDKEMASINSATRPAGAVATASRPMGGMSTTQIPTGTASRTRSRPQCDWWTQL